ncbi:transmembrane protease serine 7-like [Acipenser ruthenus]|uniref:transmembrane protease serine 7-like n=1 Tax=Acipenser ruthenus TaxID=7906 RepID=UPI0027419F02|nr:transmembrane protease serine 7-like [Acipenser ruthenus]
MAENGSDASGQTEDNLSISDVSVEVATVDAKLAKRRHHRKGKRKSRSKKKARKRNTSVWKSRNLVILVTVLIVVFVVTMWTLLWYFVLQPENSSLVYFAGLFRLAQTDFIPEYRHRDSREFLSMAQNIEHVVNSVYKTSAVSRLYRQSVISDLSSNNDGGLLVHFWMVFVVPKSKSQFVCEDCVGAILKDSIQTSLVNRSSVGYLSDLPVDMDSVIVNAALRSDYSALGTESQCLNDLYAEHPGFKVPLNVSSPSGRGDCHLKITALLGHLVRLSIVSMQIEENDCVSDSLVFYDSLMPIRSKVLYKICGPFNSSTVSFVSTGNMMFLSFKSGPGKKGFHGYFEAIAQERCGNTLETRSVRSYEGRITSPYYPSFYPPKCSCAWVFQTPVKTLGIALKFSNYVLKEKGLKGCEHGWWKINENLYCGSYIDHQTVFHVASPKVEIEFQCSSKLSDPPLIAEYGSYNISQPCPDEHFSCTTGLCIRESQHCDGLDDCYDESDELFCSIPSKVCNVSSKQHPYYACNGVPDCDNGSDESNCTQAAPCTNITYKCKNDVCIRKRNAKCDGVPDCADRSDESSCGCGSKPQAQSRVVGGTNADEGAWPWQVGLHFAGSLYCGASVIAKEWLISAAHCFSSDRFSDPRPWTAHLGMRVQGSPKFVAQIRRIVAHEYYNARNFDYDVALLQLKTAWPDSLSHLIQPVCIPALAQPLQPGDRCWVTGWGSMSEGDKDYPTVLQEAEVEIIDQRLCQNRYGPLSPRMVCAGVMSGKRDACRGDSGGPLSCQEKRGGRWFLTGIVSWGVGCGRPNLPGVYTRVSKFATWIQNYVS